MDSSLDGGCSPERPSHDWKRGTFSSTLHSLGKGKGLEMELMIHHAYMMKPRWESHEFGVRGATRLVNTSMLGEWQTQNPRGHELLCLATFQTSPDVSLHLVTGNNLELAIGIWGGRSSLVVGLRPWPVGCELTPVSVRIEFNCWTLS